MPVSKKFKQTEPASYWRSDCGRVVVYVGDCREVLPLLAPQQFHAVVTDPPYGLEFMGEQWDAPWKNEGKVEVCDEGTDKSHPFWDGTHRVRYGNNRARRVDARERRAEEMADPVKAKYLRHNVEYVRDSHLYQEWFAECAAAVLASAKPGAHVLSFGGTRMWHRMACAMEDVGWEMRDCMMWLYGSGFPKSMDIGKAIDKTHGVEREVVGRDGGGLGAGQFTQAAGRDGGYGFKSEYDRTVPATENARLWDGWGTGLKPAWEPVIVARKPVRGSVAECVLEHGCGAINVDGCRVGGSGGTTSPAGAEPNGLNEVYGEGMGGLPAVDAGKERWPANVVHDGSEEVVLRLPDGACRFFYTAKAGGDRDRPHAKGSTLHPTVKPLDLMQYLVRLVCVRGGRVLDPFMGSGSTGCAAIAEGMAFTGVELSREYADVAVGRLRLALDAVHSPWLPSGPATRVPRPQAGPTAPPRRLR